MAVSVAAMVILLSVFNGFETLVKSMYSAFDADLTLTPRRGQTFVQTELDTAALRRIPGVAALSCTLEQSVLLEHAGRQATATVRGVDDSSGEVFDLEDAVRRANSGVPPGRSGAAGHRTVDGLDAGDPHAGGCRRTLYAVRRVGSTLLPMDNYTRRTGPSAESMCWTSIRSGPTC